MKRLKKTIGRWGFLGVAAVVVVALAFTFVPSVGESIRIHSEGAVSFETRVALAANLGQMGTGEPVPQEIVEPTFGRGGPPVVSIVFDDPVDEEADALTIYWNGLPTSHVKKSVMGKKNPGQGEAEAEAEAETEAEGQVREQSLEIWTLLSLFPDDDPVMQDPPVLLDNERIEKYRGKEYLVTTLGYIDIHIFSLEPLKFTVKINGLDAGPVIGEWWK